MKKELALAFAVFMLSLTQTTQATASDRTCEADLVAFGSGEKVLATIEIKGNQAHIEYVENGEKITTGGQLIEMAANDPLLETLLADFYADRQIDPNQTDVLALRLPQKTGKFEF